MTNYRERAAQTGRALQDETADRQRTPILKMKKCSSCGLLKPEGDFNFLQKDKGKRMCVCKSCEHESKKMSREHKKSILERLKSVGCACCGESDTVCLDFHHYDQNEKEFNMSSAITKPVNKLIEEASKCVVVCSNCHRKIHSGSIRIEDYLPRHEYEYRRFIIRTAFSEKK